ncbi:MAG TPA: DUF4394 domain-containing protein [Chthoniobacteraceae bacterium]|nr:DUF4394 domain-containing protein [Chthoniobacteraceae bacterium]
MPQHSPLSRVPRTVIEPLEARIAPAIIYAVTADNHLITFDSAAPATILSTVAISGLVAPTTEHVAGIDFRPSTGQLYALGINDFNAGVDEGVLYTLNPKTGVASNVLFNGGGSLISSDFTDGAHYGVTFDPVADVLRVVNDAGQNFRDDANTGFLKAQDTALSSGTIVAAAYDHSVAGTTAATLFGLDATSNSVVRIGDIGGTPGSANGGAVTSLGALGVTASSHFGALEIAPRTGEAFAILDNGTTTNLYLLNLAAATGAAMDLGGIGTGLVKMVGMAVAPTGDLVIAANGKSATYLDFDGDKVSVTLSKGALSAAQFTFRAGELGSQLLRFEFAPNPADKALFADASLTFAASPVKGHGDGYAHVGFIDATGIDLGKVTVDGDLGLITAGDISADGDMALASLTVHSMGALGKSTQLPGGSLESSISGRLGALSIKTDLLGARVAAVGVASSMGNITIGGDVVAANDGITHAGVSSLGSMGNVAIGGSLVGGSMLNDGNISSGQDMGKVTVGGSLIGGAGQATGAISCVGSMGAVKIGGDLVGGGGDFSGYLSGVSGIASVAVGGSLLGGTTDPAHGARSGSIYSNGSIPGTVKIGGDIVGGVSSESGRLYAGGQLGAVTIGGSVSGRGMFTGMIEGLNGIAGVKIGGDLRALPNVANQGVIISFKVVGPVTIAGSVLNGGISATTLGAVTIGGDLRAEANATTSINADGVADNAAPAIKSLTVKGSVVNAIVSASMRPFVNPDAGIGAVTVGGNWIASSLLAGTDSGDAKIGDEDDVKGAEPLFDVLLSSISSITISGFVAGTVGGTDHFGFVAEKIGSMKVGGVKVPLTTGLDKVGFALGVTGDVRVREVDDTSAVFPVTVLVPNGLAVQSPKQATYHDADGDLVTVKTSKPGLDLSDFTFATDADGAQFLQLDLHNEGAGFKGADVTITATPDHGLGDGFAHVGFINATGLDLGKVSVDGDLGRLVAGNSATGGVAVASLTAHSMGLYGTATQLAGGDLVSTLNGRLGALTVKTDVVNARIETTDSTAANGSIGNLTIGGDIIGGAAQSGVFSSGAMGGVKLGGSLIGGSVFKSGSIESGGKMAGVTLGGSIFGGSGVGSGILQSGGDLGAVKIKGAVIGGTNSGSGTVDAAGNITSVTLGGSLVGGDTTDPVNQNSSGAIFANAAVLLPGVTHNIGPVKIGGSLRGANNLFSGQLVANGNIASISVAGSLIGGAGVQSGSIGATGKLGPIKVAGDLRGGAGNYSGSVTNIVSGSIGTVTIGGSLVGGGNAFTGLLSFNTMGAVTVGGSVRAIDPAQGVRISAQGAADHAGGLAGLTVKGSVRSALILAGDDLVGSPTNSDATIGSVTVGGDWLASSLAAGVNPGAGGFYGNGDDTKITEAAPDTLFAKIASITIKGFAAGTPGVAGDHVGFVAEQIGRLTIGAWKAPLTTGPDTAGIAITGDLRAREV